MKALELVGLGIVIWGLSLIWPEVNRPLKTPVMLGGALAMGVVAAAYLLLQRVEFGREDGGNGQDHRPHSASATASH